MRNAVILLLMGLNLLSGCAPVIVAAGASAASAVIYDERNIDAMYHDAEIAQQARHNIKTDPELEGLNHISIASFNGNVLMVGQVARSELSSKAYQLVNEVQGVKHIHNEVTVEGLTSTATRSNDAWITTKVKSAMLAEKGLHSAQIKVITENGVVYLMGLVTQRHAEIATTVARSVKGVRKVVRAFEYL